MELRRPGVLLNGRMALASAATLADQSQRIRFQQLSSSPDMHHSTEGCQHCFARLGCSIGATLAVVVATSRRSRGYFRLRLRATGVAAAEVEALKKKQGEVEGEVAAVEERLSAAENKLRKAAAFKLPEQDDLASEVAELQNQVNEVKSKLQDVINKIPAPPPGSVYTAPLTASLLAPLAADDEAARKVSLEKLDRLLAPAVDAEVNGSPTTEVLGAEAKVMDFMNSELTSWLRGFETAEQQLPKRVYSLQELMDNGVDPAKLLNPTSGGTLDKVRGAILLLLSIGGAAAIIAYQLSFFIVLAVAFIGLLAIFADQIANGGFAALLILDTIGRVIDGGYAKRVAQHEAGHFLVAYLVGVLPKAYTLSAWEAFSRFKTVNVQAGAIFCDSAIQKELQSGKISGKSVDKIICIALGGISAEYVLCGQAEGGAADIQQLELLFQSLKFDQSKTDANLRWAVLNTVGLLKRNADTHGAVTEAMLRGASVGECIRIIEENMTVSESANIG